MRYLKKFEYFDDYDSWSRGDVIVYCEDDAKKFKKDKKYIIVDISPRDTIKVEDYDTGERYDFWTHKELFKSLYEWQLENDMTLFNI